MGRIKCNLVNHVIRIFSMNYLKKDYTRIYDILVILIVISPISLSLSLFTCYNESQSALVWNRKTPRLSIRFLQFIAMRIFRRDSTPQSGRCRVAFSRTTVNGTGSNFSKLLVLPCTFSVSSLRANKPPKNP